MAGDKGISAAEPSRRRGGDAGCGVGRREEQLESSSAFVRVRLTLGSFRFRRCGGLDKGQVSFKDASFFQAPSSACS